MNVRTDRQIDRQTEFTDTTYMWGSIRLAPNTHVFDPKPDTHNTHTTHTTHIL